MRRARKAADMRALQVALDGFGAADGIPAELERNGRWLEWSTRSELLESEVDSILKTQTDKAALDAALDRAAEIDTLGSELGAQLSSSYQDVLRRARDVAADVKTLEAELDDAIAERSTRRLGKALDEAAAREVAAYSGTPEGPRSQ